MAWVNLGLTPSCYEALVQRMPWIDEHSDGGS